MNKHNIQRDLNVFLSDFFINHRINQIATPNEDEVLSCLRETYSMFCLDDVPSKNMQNFPEISREFIKIATGGMGSVATATLKKYSNSQVVTQNKSNRSMSIVSAIESNASHLLSPFTGGVEQFYCSLGREWIYHSTSRNEVCLASQISDIGSSPDLETLWVFPGRQLIFYVKNGMSEEQILRAISKMLVLCIRNKDELLQYLTKSEKILNRKLALTDIEAPHIGHNLWNIQSGWSQIFDAIHCGDVKDFILHDHQDFFGSLDKLFFDKIPADSSLTYVQGDEQIFSLMLNENLLLHTIKDYYIGKNLISRVMRQAVIESTPSYISCIENFRKTCYPIIAIDVRLNNRSWIEQEQGYANLINALKEDFPSIGIVIHGMSCDTIKAWTTAAMSIEDEIEVSKKIQSRIFPNIQCIDIVGSKISEAIVAISVCDYFIGHIGSGMTIMKWVANLPGLAFSNSYVLNRDNWRTWPLYVFDNLNCREGAIPSEYISGIQVIDVDNGGDGLRQNFHLDWRKIYKMVRSLISPTRGRYIKFFER